MVLRRLLREIKQERRPRPPAESALREPKYIQVKTFTTNKKQESEKIWRNLPNLNV